MNEIADGRVAVAATETLRRRVVIANRRGLHARAAAKFVQVASEFDAVVSVARKETVVSGDSIMGLMMLAAGLGCEIELRASGRQAAAAVTSLADLVESGLDER